MTYPGFKLGPLNFDLEPRRVLGYIGPNGAGKTTTMHCLAGLVRADQGTMKIFGRENNLHHRDWRFDIGYVDDVHVFYEGWTAQENMKSQHIDVLKDRVANLETIILEKERVNRFDELGKE